MTRSTQCRLGTLQPVSVGSRPGEAGREHPRSLRRHTPPPPDLPVPERQRFCRWAGPAQGAEASVTGYTHARPSCSSFHLPSATHPAGPGLGILPDFFQPSPGQGRRQMQGTHWTRPTGPPGPHWTTLVPGEEAPPPASFLSHTGHRIGGNGQERPTPAAVLSRGRLLSYPDTLDLGVTPAVTLSHSPLLPTHRTATRPSQPTCFCGVNARMGTEGAIAQGRGWGFYRSYHIGFSIITWGLYIWGERDTDFYTNIWT